MKSFTDIEQSKKLAEILPLESADMAWYPSYAKDGYSIRMLNDTYPLDIIGDKNYDEIPAWSLAALLNISPKETRLLKSATDDTYHCDCPKGNIGKWFDDPIDACYEMICKLKESEDERIRKDCIKYLDWEYQHCYTNGDKMRIEKCIAWLEKQDKQRPYEWHSDDEQNLNATLSYIDDEYLRRWLKDVIHAKYEQCGGRVNDKDCVTCVDDNMKEQKVEPKFKAGDWIVGDEGKCNKIKSVYAVDGGYYIATDKDGEDNRICFSIANEYFHLWTIQNAKDGDVLVCPSDIGDRLVVFIFKQLVNHASEIDCHCCIDANGIFDPCLNDCCYVGDASRGDYAPATKEQRDLLFQKMADAGYEWDNEKKKLKKIERIKL